MAVERVITRKPLYESYARGIGFLRYPAGASVPKPEYERLTGQKAKPVKDDAVPETADAPAKPVEKMNRAELIALAASKGVQHDEEATKAQIIAALTAAG